VPTAAKPCGTGGGNYVLRISPLAAVIARGGTVVLTSRLLQSGRICQAGLTVALYTRGPGTTLFHISRTLTTDAQGLVQATYTRPGADFRWYVRHSTAVSGIGLVQVR
jgi:hypothetical protein